MLRLVMFSLVIGLLCAASAAHAQDAIVPPERPWQFGVLYTVTDADGNRSWKLYDQIESVTPRQFRIIVGDGSDGSPMVAQMYIIEGKHSRLRYALIHVHSEELHLLPPDLLPNQEIAVELVPFDLGDPEAWEKLHKVQNYSLLSGRN